MEKELLAKLVVLHSRFRSLYMLLASEPSLMIDLERRVLGGEYQPGPHDSLITKWAKYPDVNLWVRTGRTFDTGNPEIDVRRIREYLFLMKRIEESPTHTREMLVQKPRVSESQLPESEGEVIPSAVDVPERLTTYRGPGYLTPSRLAEVASDPGLEDYLRVLVIISNPLSSPGRERTGDRQTLREFQIMQQPSPNDQISFEIASLLELRREWQDLVNLVSSQHGPIALFRLAPPTLEALQLAVMREATHGGFHIIHFTGHGYPEGLIMEDEAGRGTVVSIEQLAKVLGNKADLVVLNVCASLMPARALASAGVRTVIGTTAPITDETGATLTSMLYSGLVSGRSIGKSFEIAQATVRKKFSDSEAEKILLIGSGDRPLFLSTSRAAKPFIVSNEPVSNAPKRFLFVNRRQELTWIATTLRSVTTRIVAVCGLGGIGKSSLVSEVARRLSWYFPGGTAWVSNRAEEKVTFEQMLKQIAGLLNIEINEQSMTKSIQSITDELRRTACLLVVDGIDDLTSSEQIRFADFFATLDPYSGTKIIVTARTLPHEIEKIDGIATLSLREGLDESSSLELLHALARQRGIEHAFETNRDSLVDIVRLIGGHPLALEILTNFSARVGVDRAVEMIRQFSGPVEDKLGQVLSISLNKLSETAKVVLLRLTLFTAPIPYKTIAALSKDVSSKLDEALEELSSYSLLQIYQERYSIHPIVKALVQERLGTAQQEVRERFVAYFTEYASKHANDFSAIDSEYGNIKLALQETLQTSDHSSTIVILEAIVSYILVSGKWTDATELLSNAVIVARKAKNVSASNYFQCALAHAHRRQGDIKLAESVIQKAIKQAAKNRARRSLCLVELGLLYMLLGTYDAAVDAFEESVANRRNIKDFKGLAESLRSLGIVKILQSDYRTANKYLKEALELSKEHQDMIGVGLSLLELGRLALFQSEYGQAMELLNSAIQTNKGLKAYPSIAEGLSIIGEVYYCRGEWANARRFYEQALAAQRGLGDKKNLCDTLLRLGMLAHAQHYSEDAEKLYRSSLEIANGLGSIREIAQIYTQLGLLYASEKMVEKATQHLQQAIENANRIASRHLVAKAQLVQAQAYVGQDKPEQAMDTLKSVLEVLREIEAKLDLGLALAVAAKATYMLGNQEKAKEFSDECQEVLRNVDAPILSVAREWLTMKPSEDSTTYFAPLMLQQFYTSSKPTARITKHKNTQ